MVCDICFKTYEGKSSLSRHIIRCHTNQRAYTCHICGFASKTKDDLNKHVDTHNPNIAYVCDHCGKSVRTKKSLKRHKESHSDTFNYICSTCGMKFKAYTALNYHINMIHKGKPECSKCGQSFMNIASHVQVCGQRNRVALFDCQKCDRKFRSKKTLSEHIIRKHTDPDRYKCPFCSTRYSHSSSLAYHNLRCPKRPMDGFWEDSSVNENVDTKKDSNEVSNQSVEDELNQLFS